MTTELHHIMFGILEIVQAGGGEVEAIDGAILLRSEEPLIEAKRNVLKFNNWNWNEEDKCWIFYT